MLARTMYIVCMLVVLSTTNSNYAQSDYRSYYNRQHSFDPESTWKTEFHINRKSRGGFYLTAVVTLNRLAQIFAPVLVFSPDEPVLSRNEILYPPLDRPEFLSYADYKIPHPTYFRFETKSEDPIVYYRISEIQATCEATDYLVQNGVSIDSYELKLKLVQEIAIEYYFYYPYEEGFGEHTDDIESIKVEIDVFNKNAPDDSSFIGLSQITGRAHGSFWLDNVLNVAKIEQDIAMPITILVEEGKHASCPDRNADGVYTPGYDVNTKIYDAWGIRDNQRTGIFYSPAYKTWMTKVRSSYHQTQNKVFPPYFSQHSLAAYDLRYFRDSTQVLDSFTIYKPFNAESTFEAVGESFDKLDSLAQDTKSRARTVYRLEDFLERYSVLKENLKSKPKFKNPIEAQNDWLDRHGSKIIPGNFWHKLGLSFRYDGQPKIVTHLPFLLSRNYEVPFVKGWILPRLTTQINKTQNAIREYGLQLFYTRSASRNFDWYSVIGYEKIEVKEIIEMQNEEFELYRADWQTNLEAGIKFAVNTNNPTLRFLGYLLPSGWFGKPGFIGGRLGISIRRPFDKEFESLRIVYEVGTGSW